MVREIDTSSDQRTSPAEQDATELRNSDTTMERDAGSESALRTLRGRFVLQKKLGDGGMGTVYRALDLGAQLHQDPNSFVALKTLNPEVLRGYPNARTALQREASRARQITHQNIIRVYDFYDVAPPDNECFITMELLEGQTLDALLKAHPRGLSKRHTFFLLEGICQGLQFAHDRGFVHSDLKPSNIFLTNDGAIRILDLGIATPIRSSSRAGKQDTIWNPRALGALTPAYASLEQWLRMDADPRDDVYSLGVMIYEMLTGKHPFEVTEEGKLEKLPAPKAAKLSLSPARIRSLSRKQNAAVAQALQFDREKRTASIEQLYSDITGGESTVKSGAMLLGAAATALLGLAIGSWIFLRSDGNRDVDGPTPSDVAATVATVEPAPIETIVSANDRFRDECRTEMTRAGLEVLIERGLAAQTTIVLGGSEQGAKAQIAVMSDTAQCVRQLAERGIESAEGNQWLKDAAAILTAAPTP
jgi:serine/threonine protein kinase